MSFTQEGIDGEWIYLEGEQPLTPDLPVWTFEDGRLLVDGADAGSYTIGGGELVIEFAPTGDARRHQVTLSPMGELPVTSSTSSLAANSQLWFDQIDDDNEPVSQYGCLVRKHAADEMSAAIAGHEVDEPEQE